MVDHSISQRSCMPRERAATPKTAGYCDVKLTVTLMVAAAKSAFAQMNLPYAASNPQITSRPRPLIQPPLVKLKIATPKVTAKDTTSAALIKI